ncbi:hypothetical protein [Sphingosinicella sp.]|uniref:hypothetical protein n=1 Tax=Sphingosinicella sp. TaxID=1917971 RepID=UPI00403783CE
MQMPIATLDDRVSVSSAWRNAVGYLKQQPGRKCYNLAYMVTQPDAWTQEDASTIAAFDEFAKGAGRHPVTTVANTIFPLACYRVRGADGVFEHYPDEIYPRVKTTWGTYAERMLRRRDAQGNLLRHRDGQLVNPLKSLTEKLRHRVAAARGTKTHYELPVSDEVFEISTYDPVRDARYPRGGPCLSHLSFKLDPSNNVRLTAFYRSHFYLDRALGNLVGLGRLQRFVADQAECDVGPLTLIASEACVESSLGTAKAAAVNDFLAKLGI